MFRRKAFFYNTLIWTLIRTLIETLILFPIIPDYEKFTMLDNFVKNITRKTENALICINRKRKMKENDDYLGKN